MISICFILFLLISILTSSYGQMTCASGWVQYGGSCYRSYFSGTWDQCNAYCPTSYPGATMLCVNNEAENSWIVSQYGGMFWIGYTDMPPYGGGKGTKQYGWVTGCSSTYTNWVFGEPNNLNNIEDYAHVWDISHSYQWNDNTATNTMSCSCQYKPPPSSGPIIAPSPGPSAAPSSGPTVAPSLGPTVAPSSGPTLAPSLGSTVAPSSRPSTAPSSCPSTVPSSRPSTLPTSRPSTVSSTCPSAVSSSCPSVAPSISPTVVPYELPSCPAGWTLQCGCQWSPPSPRRFLQSTLDGVIHMHDNYDRFAVGFMACLMMMMVLYFCTYVVGKVQRAYTVEAIP